MRRLLVALATVLLAACGQGASPLEVLAAAPAAASEARTLRFTLDMRTQLPGPEGQSFTVTGGGEADLAEHRFRADMTVDLDGVEGAPSRVDSEMVLVGTTIYMRTPMLAAMLPEGVSWARLDLERAGEAAGIDLSQLLQGNNADPTAWLEMLRGTAEVEEVGQEEIRGVATTHYRVSLSREDALEQAPEDARDRLRSLFDEMQVPDRFPVDVWVDDDGLVRRFEQRLEMTPPGSAGPVQQSATVEYFDYGAEVDVQPPPEDQTADLMELIPGGGPPVPTATPAG